jgi:hypothetical protein
MNTASVAEEQDYSWARHPSGSRTPGRTYLAVGRTLVAAESDCTERERSLVGHKCNPGVAAHSAVDMNNKVEVGTEM